MYTTDEKDQVIPLKDFPQSSIGAPIPIVLSDEYTIVVAFHLQNPDGWDGRLVRKVTRESEEPIAIVRFSSCYAYYSGAPNDEAFEGHPLKQAGLHPNGGFEIKNSSWIRRLEKMNSVHPHHNPDRFWASKHFILTFHDSTFECIADGYDIEIARGTPNGAVPRMLELLDSKAT
jgi:hypothetical protein